MSYVTRLFIEKNMQFTIALMLQEQYNTLIECETSVEGLEALMKRFALDAIERVRGLRENNLSDPMIRKCDEYITIHFKENLTLGKLADILGVNPDVLSRKFIRETGESVPDSIRRHKMEEAERLLRITDDSIALIGNLIGYKTASQFSQTFKRAFGVTPSEYRQKGLKYIEREKNWNLKDLDEEA